MKWVSLMLWVGADPYSRGPDDPEDEPDPESDNNAVELAAAYENFDIFKLKGIQLDPSNPDTHELLKEACYSKSADFLKNFDLCNKDYFVRMAPDQWQLHRSKKCFHQVGSLK